MESNRGRFTSPHPDGPSVLHPGSAGVRPAWPSGCGPSAGPGRELDDPPRPSRVLITDDEPNIRMAVRFLLEAEGIDCDEASDGLAALEAALARPYDVVILDVDMPRMKGTDVCRELRAAEPGSHLKIIMISGRATPDEMARMLSSGADDYLGKPFGAVQLQERVKAALRRKGQEDASDRLTRELREVNLGLSRAVVSRDQDLYDARASLVRGLAKLAECRDNDTGSHLLRLGLYSVCLGEAIAESPSAGLGPVDGDFLTLLRCCAPLHDIGKVGLPDHVLRKPSRLDPGERRLMESHTIIGYEALRSLVDKNGFALDLLAMGMDIARHHHERFDGRGYPDRLVGDRIPLTARIVTICDVYDALRSRRVYKPPMPHDAVVRQMSDFGSGAFDPRLLRLFLLRADRFERIFHEAGPDSREAPLLLGLPAGPGG